MTQVSAHRHGDPTRDVLVPALITLHLAVGAAALLAPAMPVAGRVAVVGTLVAHLAVRTWWHRRHRGTAPVLPAVLDLVLTLVVLLLVPPLGVPGLFVILLLVARLAALRGFRAAAWLATVAFVSIAVRAATLGDVVTPEVWLLVVLFGVTSLLTASLIDRVVQQRDAAAAHLRRIEHAVRELNGGLASHPEGLSGALADVTARLVDGVTAVQVVPGDTAVDDLLPAVASPGAATLPVRTVVPVRAGDRTIATIVVDSERPIAPTDELVLELWAERTASAVLLDGARRREVAARLELEEAARQREDLVARISHDLKVPLATVYASAQTLVEQADRLDPALTATLHQMLARNAGRLRRWVDDLFDDATSGHERTFTYVRRPVRVLVEEAVEASTDALRHHRVVTRIRDDETVLVDDDAVSRVLTNLLANAAKFSPRGTRVTVDTDVREDDVVVTVTDEGPGIPEDDLVAVFEPWARRGNGDVDGAGLGLSTVRQLVQRWHGDVWAESPGRQGARIAFTLPLVDDRRSRLDDAAGTVAVDEAVVWTSQPVA